MDQPEAPRRIAQTDADGAPAATADLQPDPTRSTTVVARVHVESGHHDPGTASRLIDEVMDSPEVQGAEDVVAVVPRGQAEALQRVQQRLSDPQTRSAGASSIVEGRAPSD